MHHRPFRHHHRPAFPIQIPTHFPAQETQAADRSVSLCSPGCCFTSEAWTSNTDRDKCQIKVKPRPLITILVLSYSLIIHFTFVLSLIYILTCVSYVELCNSACREAKPPHLFGLFCVPSCDLACRGTARTPLTLSVLRMWMRKHCRTISHILIRPCCQSVCPVCNVSKLAKL